MRRHLAVAMALMVALGIIHTGVAWAQDDEGPMSNMHFVVVRDLNGKPVRNAAVVLHPVTKKGKQAKGGLELKTDAEGRTGIDGIPYGPLRIQVLAPGFQTFGEDYQVNQPEMEITVKLKRPGPQYSVYENHPADKKSDDKKASDGKTAGKKPDDKAGEQKPQ
jgi:hypothetical protein